MNYKECIKRKSKIQSDLTLISESELAIEWGVLAPVVREEIKRLKIRLQKQAGEERFYSRQECNSKLPFLNKTHAEEEPSTVPDGLITRDDMLKRLKMSEGQFSAFIFRYGIYAIKTQYIYGKKVSFFKIDQCDRAMQKELHRHKSRVDAISDKNLVTVKQLAAEWNEPVNRIYPFLRKNNICAKKTITSKNNVKFYSREECERARQFINQQKKEVGKVEQVNLPEPKEQTPDIIPADTIDLFTMLELETELKNRGVELTAEVKAKINASDMPEMQEIATMISGNAKTIAIRLSVLNEIAGQLREVKRDGKNELLDEIGKPRVLWLNMQERIVFEFLRHKTNYTPKRDIVEHFKAMRQPIGDSAANRMVWSAISVLRDMGCLDAKDGCFIINHNYASTEAESREVWAGTDAIKRKTDPSSIDIGLENGRPINDKIKESGWWTVGIISEISGKSESWLRSHLPIEDCLIAYGNDKLIKAWMPKRVIKWLNDRNIFVQGWGDMIKRPKNGMRKYNPDFDKIAFDMASQNKSDTEISNQLDVSLETFNKYKKEIPSFANAINSGMSAYISSITSLQSNEKNQENKGVCINQDLKDKIRFMAMADNVDLAAKLESIIMAAWIMGNYDNK